MSLGWAFWKGSKHSDVTSIPQKVLAVLCGVSRPPEKVMVTFSSACSCPLRPELQAGDSPTNYVGTMTKKVPGPTGGPAPHSVPRPHPSSPGTCHVEIKAPSARDLMRTSFPRRLLSGVRLVQGRVSRGELERPHPSRLPLYANPGMMPPGRGWGGSPGKTLPRAWPHGNPPRTQTPQEGGLLLDLGHKAGLARRWHTQQPLLQLVADRTLWALLPHP